MGLKKKVNYLINNEHFIIIPEEQECESLKLSGLLTDFLVARMRKKKRREATMKNFSQQTSVRREA